MNKNNLKRFLASLLAVLMLSQVTGVAPGVFALDETGTTEPTESAEPVAPVLKENTGAVEVLIKSDTDVQRHFWQTTANLPKSKSLQSIGSMSAKDI